WRLSKLFSPLLKGALDWLRSKNLSARRRSSVTKLSYCSTQAAVTNTLKRGAPLSGRRAPAYNPGREQSDMSLPVLPLLLGSTIFPVIGVLFGQTPYSTNGDLALVRGTIYVSPTEQPIRDGVVLIRAGRIVAVGSSAVVQIPQTAQLIDCSGLTITAGFW